MNVLTKIGYEGSWTAIRVRLFLPSQVTVVSCATMYIVEEYHGILDQINQAKRVAQPFRVIF